MATVILVRHGRTAANASGTLAGRLPGVHLDDVGRGQADAVAARLSGVRLSGIVTSPLERCRETAAAIAAAQSARPPVRRDRALLECDYGAWQGRPLKELARLKLWKQVQEHPSSVVFPEGESLRSVQDRAVAAVRRHDQGFGPRDVWALVSHGDVIKAILADALGTHLDLFQRIHVDPASASVVRYAPERPYVLSTNSHEGDLAWVAGGRPRRRGADVGGGAGPRGPRS